MKADYIRCLAVAGLLWTVIGITGCCTTPKLQREVDDALVNWLDCEDCLDKEFDTLTDYCEKYVASRLALIAANGPPPETLQVYEEELRARYNRRKNYALATPGVDVPAITEDEYVDMHTTSLVRKQKARAIAALKEVSKKKSAFKWIDDAPSVP